MAKKRTDGAEVSGLSKPQVERQTSQPIGQLQDPRAPEEEMVDDYSSFVQRDGDDLRHKPDPRFVDVIAQESKIKRWAVGSNRLTRTGRATYEAAGPAGTREKMLNVYQDMAKKHGRDIVMEFSDNAFRARRVSTDISSPVAVFQDLATAYKVPGKSGMMLETADDDRVIGIPYTISNIGVDKYYIINGRVYSGWAMWFGLQAVRAPEDYARNVDLTYNVSFIWAGFQLKSRLSLGASFDITMGSDEEQTPEENFVNGIFKTKLKIGSNALMKTSFHLDVYGNSYWHIRRDANGFPDKITILQPERIKVFLDPKTTKILYYIYLPPILAGMALTPYPNIRQNPSIMAGPALTYPTPIVIDPQDIIHYKENDFTEYPFGLSSCKAMIDPATARMDINLIAPMIFKRYAKPLIHWKLDPMMPFQLTKGQIENYIDGFKTTLENLEPMSDPITSTRWSAAPIGAAQGKAELLTIVQDLDNQIFCCIGVPETYFKPQMGQDRMISEQDKVFIASMEGRQNMVGEKIQDKLIKPTIDRYDQMMNIQLDEQGLAMLPERQWNEYPVLQWRETFKQDQVTTIQNTMALLQAGLVDRSRAARRVGEAPPQESQELSRQMDLQKITQEVQIAQAELQYQQTQLQILDTNQAIAAGGTAAYQAAVAGMMGEGAGGSGGSGGSGGKKEGGGEQKVKVTFRNKQGKRQTETMNQSTLNDTKKGGRSVEKVEAAQQ